MSHAQNETRGPPERQAAAGVLSGPLAFTRCDLDAPLAQLWKQLEARAFLPTQTLDFTRSLAHTLLSDAVMEVFATTDHGGALLPLCRAPSLLAPWRLVGAREVFEPNDALCSGPASAHALAEQLIRNRRALWLDRVPALSPLIPAMKDAMKGQGLLIIRPAVACPTLPLDDSWSEPENHFSSRRRSDFRRAARKAAEFGEVTFEVLSPSPDTFDALFDEAIGVEVRSWKKQAGTAIATDEAKEAFFRDYFRSASAAGQLRIAFLRIDGKPAATQMALEWSDRYWVFKIGYDESYSKASPGTLLMLHTIGWAARNRLTAYELLGGAEPWIANFWTKEQHDTLQLRCFPYSASGVHSLLTFAMNTARQRLSRAWG